MAKPIFLVALPHGAVDQIHDIQKNLEEKITDYYPVVYLHGKDEVEFRALYDKDFDEVKFEELKEIVRGSLSS